MSETPQRDIDQKTYYAALGLFLMARRYTTKADAMYQELRALLAAGDDDRLDHLMDEVYSPDGEPDFDRALAKEGIVLAARSSSEPA